MAGVLALGVLEMFLGLLQLPLLLCSVGVQEEGFTFIFFILVYIFWIFTAQNSCNRCDLFIFSLSKTFTITKAFILQETNR